MDDTAARGPGDGITRWRAHPATGPAFELAEGPLWDGARERLLWVDIPVGAVHEGRLAGDRIEQVAMRAVDCTIGAVVAAADGTLLVAGLHRLFVMTRHGDPVPGPRLLAAGAARRLNDGACDPAGRFVVGTLALSGQGAPPGRESLVRVDEDGTATVLDADLNPSNGIAWSADGRLLFSIDSEPGVLYVRSYPGSDEAGGAAAIGPRRELSRLDGTPDGMCVDAEGALWVAFYDAAEVRRYTLTRAEDGSSHGAAADANEPGLPTGLRLIGVVEVPGARHVTSVAFVGPRLDRLLITTAIEGMPGPELERYPDSGRLFLADVGVIGLPIPAWSGFSDGVLDASLRREAE